MTDTNFSYCIYQERYAVLLSWYLFLLYCILKIGKTWQKNPSTLSFLRFYSLLEAFCQLKYHMWFVKKTSFSFCDRDYIHSLFIGNSCWLENICIYGKLYCWKTSEASLNTWLFSCPQPKMWGDYHKFERAQTKINRRISWSGLNVCPQSCRTCSFKIASWLTSNQLTCTHFHMY